MHKKIRFEEAVNVEDIMRAVDFDGTYFRLEWNGVKYNCTSLEDLFTMLAMHGVTVLDQKTYELAQLNGWVYWYNKEV